MSVVDSKLVIHIDDFAYYRPVRLAYQPPSQPAVLFSQNKPATSQANRLYMYAIVYIMWWPDLGWISFFLRWRRGEWRSKHNCRSEVPVPRTISARAYMM
jgi:hypothetical protein